MTQRDMAGILKVTPMTLRNWKKEKPRLFEIIQKGFAFEEAVKKAPENASQKVVSSMIWGSQYDAMLKWMKGNKINVTSSSPTDLSIGTTSKNTTRVTGGANNGQTVSKDKLSNIYDLLGNIREWTQEAISTAYRISRGGYYSGSYAPSSRTDNYPASTFSSYGSRLTLYIK
jgi:hypothetical protein